MQLLVFLHGLGQSPQSWQGQVTELPPGYKAVAPWLRGTRPGRTDAFDVNEAADDVLALLNTHGADSMTLVGVSVGALVALEAAIRDPDAIETLVLASPMLNPSKSVIRLQKLAFRMVPAGKLAASGIDKGRFLDALDQVCTRDHRPRLRDISAHTLALAGERDRAGQTTARTIADGVPNGEFRIVQGAGHFPNTDNPTAFNEHLYSFLL